MIVDPRVQRNSASIKALVEFLRSVIKDPKSYTDDPLLATQLRSQGSLAKFQNESLGITASSLNTVKRIAGKVVEGGFDALDRLRVAARDALLAEAQKRESSNRVTKTGLVKKVKELEEEILLVRQDMLLFSYVLQRSFVQGRNYAAKATDPAITALCLKEQRELQDILSLRNKSFSATRLVAATLPCPFSGGPCAKS